ncbi:MAG: YtxH domain-containing protein [Cyanobacteria bacterium SZAS TMP-1]|nr:YtxH domain-containing protein [Cyanobacteria bacterium SZAS TMP-1]
MRGFMFVGLASFLAGLFLAPKKGSELRSELCGKVDDLKASAKEKGNQIKEVVLPVISQVKEEGCTLKNEGKEFVQDVQACLDKNIENGKQVLENAQERLHEKVTPVVTLIKDDARGLEERAQGAVNKVHEKVDELKQKGSEAFSDLKQKVDEKVEEKAS